MPVFFLFQRDYPSRRLYVQLISVNGLFSQVLTNLVVWIFFLFLSQRIFVLCIIHGVFLGTSEIINTHSAIFASLVYFPKRSKIVKACVRYFSSNFYFFTKWSPFKNYKKRFLFHRKNSFRSWDIQIFVFFPFLSTLSRFKRANGSGIIYDAMNWLA